MSTATLSPVHPELPPMRVLASVRAAEPRLFALALILIAAMAPTLFAMGVDDRTLLGANVWMKPFKFELSLAVYLMTLSAFALLLPAGTTERRWYRVYIGVVIAAIVAEMIWIGGAAAMGMPSHFNATPAGTVIYRVMGLLATLLTSVTAVYAVLIAQNTRTGISPALKEAVVLGLALTLPLTLMTAGTMAGMQGHTVGGSGTPAVGIAMFGWARDAGDLRVAHFFATHAMHFLPALGLVAVAFFGGRARLVVRIGALGFVAFVAWTFAEALAGRPFLAALP